MIMASILANKMFNLDGGCKDKSICELVIVHKKNYPWISCKMLAEFLASFCKSVADFADCDEVTIGKVKDQIELMEVYMLDDGKNNDGDGTFNIAIVL